MQPTKWEEIVMDSHALSWVATLSWLRMWRWLWQLPLSCRPLGRWLGAEGMATEWRKQS